MAATACEVNMMDVDIYNNAYNTFSYEMDMMNIDEDYYYCNSLAVAAGNNTNYRSSFSLLPEELVFEIFSFLHGSDICNGVEKVCKGWRRLAKDDQLWLSLVRRAADPVDEDSFRKPAFKSWKWLYSSQNLILSDLEKQKDLTVGRYECAEWIYEGDWKDGKHSGYGRKTWKNIKKEGEEDESSLREEENQNQNNAAPLDQVNANQTQEQGQASPQPQRKQIKKPFLSYYEGEWKDNKEHGKGKRVFEEDHYYIGLWKEGEREGFGFYHWPNKTFYEGEFKEGFRHGHGTYTWSEKAKYIGQWQKGIEHGKGIRSWADGDRYEGDWVHGTRTGHGIYSWPNGSSYEGKWLQCAHEGYGIYSWPDGRMYKGHFMNNKKHGHGEYVWPDNAVFVGLWKSGVRHGEGTITWPDRTKFTGEWALDRRGNGRYWNADGSEVPANIGQNWQKKYDYYFAMPMEMWEHLYLPEINRLIKEKKEREEKVL